MCKKKRKKEKKQRNEKPKTKQNTPLQKKIKTKHATNFSMNSLNVFLQERAVNRTIFHTRKKIYRGYQRISSVIYIRMKKN